MRLSWLGIVGVFALLGFGCSDESGKGGTADTSDSTQSGEDNPQEGSGKETKPPAEQSCDKECPKSASCLSESVLKTCQNNAETGCVEWIESTCPENTVCQEDACVPLQPECEDACSDGKECADDSTLRECRKNPETGCMEWVESDCPENTVCQSDACVSTLPECENACSGAGECEDEHSYRKCEDTDNDGCPELSEPIPCEENQICKDGGCVLSEPVDSCKDACTENEACGSNNSYKECKDTDGDGCKELVEVSCDSAQTCSENACVCKKFNAEQPSMIHLLSDEGKGKSESTTVDGGFHDEYIYHPTKPTKIGVRQEWGGSIIFWGQDNGKPGMNSTNTIDANDTGREVQAAIYDLSRLRQWCAATASCWKDGVGLNSGAFCSESNRHLGWNPVQGGNVCNIGSGVESVSNKDGILETVTVPLQWNPDWDNGDPKACSVDICKDESKKNKRSDVRMTQRIRFINALTAEIYYRVDNIGELDHRANVQEFPTLYSAYGGHGLDDYGTLMTANNKKVTPASNTVFKTEEPWVAFVNSSKGYGVGLLYENGVLEFSGEYHPKSYNVVRSRVNFGLPKNGSVQTRVYLFLGAYDTIAEKVAEIQKRLPPFGSLDNPTGTESVSGNVKISGWALDNKKVKKVVARIDETKEVELKYGEERPDVCLTWVGYANCKKTGFSGTFSFEGYTNQCKHLIEIIATDDDNNKRTIARRLVDVK